MMNWATQSWRRLRAFCATRKGIVILSLLAVLALGFYFSLPRQLFCIPTSFVIEDRQGQLLGASIATDGQWRFPATEAVPEKFTACITTFEDKRFFYHPGVDPIAFVRAVWQNLRGNRVVSGGSTINMQVIRMSRNKPRTLWQKAVEALLAIRLEFRYSKASILRLYASHAPYGGNVVGLEAAAWRYFGRPPEQLSWAETATLAVLPNAPSLVHPGKNRERLLGKRNALLDKLAAKGVLTSEMAELSKLEPLPDNPHPLPQLAPHLLQRFKGEYASLGIEFTRAETTIDSRLQTQVADIIARHHQRFRSNGIHNAAALVLGVDSGNALAYVGNVHAPNQPEMESYVDMIPALRSPGSTLKPLLYAAMMTDGVLLPHTLIPDVPTQIGGYMPQNYDLGYDGAIPASRALSRSLNIPAVKMLQQYKYPRFHDFLKRAGISTLNRPADFYGLSMVLGGCEVTMWQLAGTYASMARSLKNYEANAGLYDPNHYHLPVYLPTTDNRRGSKPERASVMDHASLYFTFQAMKEVMRPGEEALWEQFSSSKQVAWKTGTSFGFRDGWAIGLTPDHVVCVWVGNADGEGRPGLTGIETAAPILFEIFGLLPSGDWFAPPIDRMISTAVCTESGHLAGADCPHPENLYIPAAGFKSASCPYHQTIHTDLSGQYQVSAACVSTDAIRTQSWFVLPPAMAYYYQRRNSSYRELPPYAPGCTTGDLTHAMEMIYPKNHAKLYIPLEIDGKRGQVIFNAAHRESGSRIFWHLDDEFLGETSHLHQMALTIESGKHRITLVDEAGAQLTHHFEILAK